LVVGGLGVLVYLGGLGAVWCGLFCCRQQKLGKREGKINVSKNPKHGTKGSPGQQVEQGTTTLEK